jgi:hypothetical protein
MGMPGIVTFPVGVFFVLIGVVIFVDAPYMKDMFDSIKYVEKNRRLIGASLAIIGFLLIVLK